ncbi:MAG TPA: hypothetical protein VF529_10235 [Solirubrobacteraceae bacterium]|jgi:hypothetical protein
MRTKLATAIATVAVTAAAAQPAAALETYSANGSYITPNGHKLNQGSNARVLSGDATTVTISLECFANTSAPARGTGIDVCEIRGADGSVRKSVFTGFHPGTFYATGQVFENIPRQHYRVCVRADGAWYEGSALNEEYFLAPEVCSA